jgi:hypothetical protein
MKTLLLRILLAGALFMTATAAVSYFGLGYRANAASFAKKEYVGKEDVIAYLEGVGYTNVQLLEQLDSGDWLATGMREGAVHKIIVYVEGDQIIGHEEIDQ